MLNFHLRSPYAWKQPLFCAMALALLPIPSPAASLRPLMHTTAAPANTDEATDRIIVHLRPHLHLPVAAHVYLTRVAGIPLRKVHMLPSGARIFNLSAQTPIATVRTIASRIAKDPNVLYAEPDVLLHLDPSPPAPVQRPSGLLKNGTQTPNDLLYGSQWNLSQAQTGLNLPAAWAMTTGVASQTVAVLDSGVRFDHEDLRGRLLAGYDFVKKTLNPVDNGEGRVQWHGTGTASIIGARTNNLLGMAGVNWTSNVLAIRIGTGDTAYNSDMANGLYWAGGIAVNGLPVNTTPARVINISYNGTGLCPITVQQAINTVRARGAVVVTAAGNNAQDVKTSEPANCQGVIAVAATDTSGNRAAYSNYGIGIAVAAPGNALVTAGSPTPTWNPTAFNYLLRSGTSFAAPQVAGIVSLMLSVNPSLTPDDVVAILRSSTRPFASQANCAGLCHTGIVDAGTAVWLAAPDAIKVPRPVSPAPSGSLPSPSPSPGNSGSGSTPATAGNSNPGTSPGTPSPAQSTPVPPAGTPSTGSPTTQSNTTAAPNSSTQAPPLTNPGNSTTGSANPGSSVTPPPTPGGASASTTPAAGASNVTGPGTSQSSPPPHQPSMLFVRALAGADQATYQGARVTLHASGQTDSSAHVVSYKWVQLSGAAAPVSNSHIAQPTVQAPPYSTTLVYRLYVIDNRGHAAYADTRVTVSPVRSSSSRAKRLILIR